MIEFPLNQGVKDFIVANNDQFTFIPTKNSLLLGRKIKRYILENPEIDRALISINL